MVKAVKLLVKMTVMMMAPGGTPAPSEARGREPPSFFFVFFLDLLPRWEKGFPSGPWPPWRWRGGSPSEIGSPSLFPSISRSPHQAPHGFLNYRRSVTPIMLKFLHDFVPKIIFLAPEEGPQPTYGEGTRHLGTPVTPWRTLVYVGGCGPLFALIPPPKNHKYAKISLRKFLSRLDFV